MPVLIHKIGGGNATPMSHARIFWDKFLLKSSTAISVYPSGDTAETAGLKYPTTYEGWAATTWGTEDTKELIATAAAPINVDCITIAAHNLADCGVGVQFRVEIDGEADVLTTAYYPTNNSPIMVVFDVDTPLAADTVSVVMLEPVGGWPATLPIINVFAAGNALVMPQPIFLDQAPADINTTVILSNSKSIGGQALGFSVRRQGAECQYQWGHIPNDFIYSDLLGFKNYAEIGRGFFSIAWRPSFNPITANRSPGVQYGSLAGTISSSVTGGPDYFDIKMNVVSAGAVR